MEAALHGISGGARRIGSNRRQDVIRRKCCARHAALKTRLTTVSSGAVLAERIRPDGMYARLGAAEERGADLHGARAQYQRRRHAARIGDAACRDHRDLHRIGHRGQQRKQSDLPALRRSRIERTAMAAGLRALRDDGIGARRFGGTGFRDSRNGCKPRDAPLFQPGDELRRVKPHDRGNDRRISPRAWLRIARRNPAAFASPASAGTAGPHFARNSRTRDSAASSRTGGGSGIQLFSMNAPLLLERTSFAQR